MKRTLLIWASMACMTVHSVMAQDAAVNKIIEIGQTDNQVMDHWMYSPTASAAV